MSKLQLLFDSLSLNSDWFSPDFLKQASVAQVEQSICMIKERFGAPKEIQITEGKGFILFAQARIPVIIGFDYALRINRLWFGAPQLINLLLEDVVLKLKSVVTGEISIFITVDGETVIDERSQEIMAVGSAFKLVILKAYEDAVISGEFRREQVVTLEPHDRSLPSGTLQVLSVGTPLTLELLAQLMIKISDNTATDTLIRILGKPRLEAISPRNIPFLTTRELFQLIAPTAADLRARYKASEPLTRSQLLAGLETQPLPRIDQIGCMATWQNVEWYLSAREIGELLRNVQQAPSLDSTSEPLFNELNWRKIGFKGGSEYGVLNLSAIGITSLGNEICVVVTANGDMPQPEEQIAPLFADLLRVAGSQISSR